MYVVKAIIAFAFLVMIALIAPILAPYNVDEIVSKPFEPPSFRHILGTDDIGRDVFTILLYAIRFSTIVALSATAISIAVGVPLGLIAGIMRTFDTVLLKILMVFMSIPSLLLSSVVAMSLSNLVKQPLVVLSIAIAVCTWHFVAWITRCVSKQLANEPYVESCRAIGCSYSWIVFKHILPHISSTIVACAIDRFVHAILLEAYLGFLGLNPFDTPSLGRMIREALANNAIIAGYWWLIAAPCIALTVITLILTLILVKLERPMIRT